MGSKFLRSLGRCEYWMIDEESDTEDEEYVQCIDDAYTKVYFKHEDKIMILCPEHCQELCKSNAINDEPFYNGEVFKA